MKDKNSAKGEKKHRLVRKKEKLIPSSWKDERGGETTERREEKRPMTNRRTKGEQDGLLQCRG